MKKVWSLLALGVGFSLGAGSLALDGQFKRLKSDGMPQCWIVKSSRNPACGKFKLVESPEGKSINITASATMDAGFYSVDAFPVQPGKTLRVSAMVKGIGKCNITAYVYDASGAWICSLPIAEVEATGDFGKITGELEIPSAYPVRVKGEIVDKPTGKFRIALQVPAGGEATFADVKAELK